MYDSVGLKIAPYLDWWLYLLVGAKTLCVSKMLLLLALGYGQYL
jgi:hypothetical protein